MRAIAYRNFNKFRNLGDSLNQWLIEGLFHTPAYFAAGDVKHVLPMGSILYAAREQSIVWGSGMIRPIDSSALRVEQIRSLRGRRSLETLRRAGLDIPDVPLGDPGFLIDAVIPPEWVSGGGQKRTAIIPHHTSWADPTYRVLEDRDDVVLVDMRTDDPQVLKQIAGCSTVVSESLHGLIFAMALGKPITWIARRDTPSWTFKFHDAFSVCNNAPESPVMLGAGLDVWIQEARSVLPHFNRQALLDAFPLAEVTHQIDDRVVEFARCRADAPLIVKTRLRISAAGELAQNEAAIRREVARAQRLRSYPTYTALVETRVKLSKRSLRRACGKLDANGEISYCHFVDKKTGVGFAVVIRPNGSFLAERRPMRMTHERVLLSFIEVFAARARQLRKSILKRIGRRR